MTFSVDDENVAGAIDTEVIRVAELTCLHAASAPLCDGHAVPGKPHHMVGLGALVFVVGRIDIAVRGDRHSLRPAIRGPRREVLAGAGPPLHVRAAQDRVDRAIERGGDPVGFRYVLRRRAATRPRSRLHGVVELRKEPADTAFAAPLGDPYVPPAVRRDRSWTIEDRGIRVRITGGAYLTNEVAFVREHLDPVIVGVVARDVHVAPLVGGDVPRIRELTRIQPLSTPSGHIADRQCVDRTGRSQAGPGDECGQDHEYDQRPTHDGAPLRRVDGLPSVQEHNRLSVYTRPADG
jgi:hypothetical protein